VVATTVEIPIRMIPRKNAPGGHPCATPLHADWLLMPARGHSCAIARGHTCATLALPYSQSHVLLGYELRLEQLYWQRAQPAAEEGVAFSSFSSFFFFFFFFFFSCCYLYYTIIVHTQSLQCLPTCLYIACLYAMSISMLSTA
jgi:hypothetical protein